MNLGGNQEEFWLIFWLQRCTCPYSSSGAVNTRDAAQRAEVLTYIFVWFLCWKEVWKRHRAGWGPGTSVTPRWSPSQRCGAPVPTSSWCCGSAETVRGVGRPHGSCVLGEQNFIWMSWKEHASLPPVLGLLELAGGSGQAWETRSPAVWLGVARTRWEVPTCLSRSVASASPSAVLLPVLPSPVMLSLTNWEGPNQVLALF